MSQWQQALQLHLFRRQFLQGLPPPDLRYPDGAILRLQSTQAWLCKNMFCHGMSSNDEIKNSGCCIEGDGPAYEACLRQEFFAPPERYQLRVLKEVVRRVEKAVMTCESDYYEISDELMARLATLISSIIPPEADLVQRKSYATYSLPPQGDGITLERISKMSVDGGSEADGYELDERQEQAILAAERSITLLESRSVIAGAGNTGQRTWEAALHLVAYFACEDKVDAGADGKGTHAGSRIRGKHVLELGAGTGLVSIACAKYFGARLVLATDGDEDVVQTLKRNMTLNGLDAGSNTGKHNAVDLQDSEQMNEAGKREDSDCESISCRMQANVLRWGHSLEEACIDKLLIEYPIDVVVAADVTYDQDDIAAFMSTLSRLFAATASMSCLVSATVRNEGTLGSFFSACENYRFAVETISFTRPPFELQDGLFCRVANPTIRILHITKSV